jgi:hypothetical protein
MPLQSSFPDDNGSLTGPSQISQSRTVYPRGTHSDHDPPPVAVSTGQGLIAGDGGQAFWLFVRRSSTRE